MKKTKNLLVIYPADKKITPRSNIGLGILVNELSNIDWIDGQLENDVIDAFTAKIKSKRYDVILVSITVGVDVACLSGLLKKIYFFKKWKIINDETPIIIGGQPVKHSEFREYFYNLYPDLMFYVGEGEGFLKKLDGINFAISAIKSRIKYLPGVYFRTGSEKIEIGRPAKIVSAGKIGKQSPGYLREIINKGGIIQEETSRGCPYNKCAFCPRILMGQWRGISAGEMAGHFQRLKLMGAKQIYLVDEEFFGPANRKIIIRD